MMLVRASLSAVLFALLAPALVSCGGGTLVLGGLDGGGPRADGGAGDGVISEGDATGDVSLDAADTTDGARGAGGDGNSEEATVAMCGDPTNPLLVPARAGPRCTHALAQQAFRFALCSCGDLSWPGTLTTDSFDSTTGQSTASASVGIDGHVQAATQPYHVGGSFWIAGHPVGSPALTQVIFTTTEVGKDMHVGGDMQSDALETIGGDLYTDGNITAGINIKVGGALHQPTGRSAVGVTASRGTIRETVAVAAPCDCPNSPVDVPRVVTAFAQQNDDAAAGLTPTDLNAVAGPRTVDLPCGHYQFQQIGGRDLTLHVLGAVAIAVSSNVSITGQLAIDLAPGAELDLFVAGNLALGNATAFGNQARAGDVRVYVGGSTVTLPGGKAVGANIHAPSATVTMPAATELTGSVYASHFSLGGAVTVHYDQAVLEGAACPGTAVTCGSCADCSGAAPACRQGACVACQTDADCCPPFQCAAGRCQPVGGGI
ncbi:MAG: hypothetical protein QOI66_4358 [Myxococcales bacterium]|jgi:hypothetical protein|nr:hypothetical protein [Myxococcales bacterium]